MWLVKSKYFWISTVLFLAIGLGMIWFMFPPLVQSMQSYQNESATLDTQIAAATAHQAAVKILNANETRVTSLYQTATLSLPANTDAENLTLQLRGLLDSLGLTSAVITAPFQQTATAVTPTTTTPSTTGTPTPSTQTSTGPATSVPTTANSAQSSFTVVGDMDFATAERLITRLRTMTRWNKLTSFDINQANGKTTVTITGQVFSRKAPTATFSSTDITFLDKATKLFSALTSYATAPDVTTEGTYGRSNPFAP